MATSLQDVKARQAQQLQPNIQTLPSVSVGLTTLQGFELSQRAAKLLASSSLVPKEYQGNLANCVIALNMAHRIGADPLMVMQNLYVPHGRPSWSAQFLIATFNSCGRFSAIRYEFFGEKDKDSYGCRAYATELATGEKLVGTDVTIAIAKAENWFGRNGSKWQTMPQQMLQYRAAAWFVRTVAPELSMGLHTAEEIHDVYDAEQTSEGSFAVVDEKIIKHEPESVNTETGEIHESDVKESLTTQESVKIDQKQTNNAAIEWLSHIQGIETKSGISRTHTDIKSDVRLTAEEKDDLIDELKVRQAVIVGKSK